MADNDTTGEKIVRLEVLLEEQERADKRHEETLANLETKINACFKRVDLLHTGQTEMKVVLETLEDRGRNGRAKRWGAFSIVLALVAERVFNSVIGG